MHIEQYQEITVSTNNAIKDPNSPTEHFTLSPDDVTDLLVMWGKYNRYKSQCGRRRVNSMFASLYPHRDRLFIESDIASIEAVLLKLKNANSKKKLQQYAVLEAYYKGVDLVVDGYDWSQQLTIRDISLLLSIPKSTVANRKKEAESYILSKLNNSKVNLN